MKLNRSYSAPCALVSLLLTTTPVSAQFKIAGMENASVLALKAVRTALRWDEPAEPAHIVGPICYVGTKGLGSFLITGSEGHIVLHTGMPGSGEMIEKSIIKLGSSPRTSK